MELWIWKIYVFYETLCVDSLQQIWNIKVQNRNCEAQGKGRARGGPRKVTERLFMDGGWWMVDILSLMLYTKFGCHHLPSTKSL